MDYNKLFLSTNSPSLITSEIVLKFSIWLTGLSSNTIISASLPISIDPIESSIQHDCEATLVADFIAYIGLCPPAT